MRIPKTVLYSSSTRAVSTVVVLEPSSFISLSILVKIELTLYKLGCLISQRLGLSTINCCSISPKSYFESSLSDSATVFPSGSIIVVFNFKIILFEISSLCSILVRTFTLAKSSFTSGVVTYVPHTGI